MIRLSSLMNYVQPPQQHVKRREDTISLLDLLSVLVKHRWLIIVTTVLAAGLVVAYSIYTIRAPQDAPLNFLPNVYTPEVRVRLLEKEASSLSSRLADSELGLLATLAGDGGGPSNAEFAQELLRGNALIDELAAEFNLVERLNVEQNPRTTVRKFLRNRFRTEYSGETSVLTIGFEDTDKVFATEVLEAAVARLGERFDELTLANVRDKKRVLEDSIESARADLQDVQQRLIDFQRQNGIVDIELQTEYKLTAVAGIEAEIAGVEAELRGLQETRRENDPQIRATQRQLDQLRQRHQLLLEGMGDDTQSLNIPQTQLPELSARLFNLTRDYQILQTIYSSLRSQYETLKIDEMDRSARFQIIEHAEVPEIKSGPSRSKICIIVTITVFFLAVFFSFVIEYFDRVKEDPVESKKLGEIRRMLQPRKGRDSEARPS